MYQKSTFGNLICWFALLATILIGTASFCQYSSSNYSEQGGARWVVGGSLDVASGGDLDIESGGALKIAGTQVTASAAELNTVDGATAGTATASKALVLDASSRATGLRAYVVDATTAVTLTAADSGKIYILGATSSTMTLPAAATGLIYTFCINDATTHYIDCASTDRIVGTNVDGDRISADAVGETVTLVGRGTSGTINWSVASMFGTWSDAN